MQPSPRSTRWSQRRMKRIGRALQSALEDPVVSGLWGCLVLLVAEYLEVPVELTPEVAANTREAQEDLGAAAHDRWAVTEALIAALRNRGPKELATLGDQLLDWVLATIETGLTGRTMLTPLRIERLSPDNPLRCNPDGSLAFPDDWAQIPSKRRMQYLMEYDAYTTTLSPARAPGRRRTGPTPPPTGGRPPLSEDLALRVYELRETLFEGKRRPWHVIAREVYPDRDRQYWQSDAARQRLTRLWDRGETLARQRARKFSDGSN
jgi:hypothetical protein